MFHVRSMRRRGRSRVGAQPRRYNQFGRRSRRICHPLRCSDVRKRSVSFGRGAQHWCPRVAAVTVIRRRRSRDRQTRTPTYFVGGQRGYKRFTVNRKVYQWRRNFLFFFLWGGSIFVHVYALVRFRKLVWKILLGHLWFTASLRK